VNKNRIGNCPRGRYRCMRCGEDGSRGGRRHNAKSCTAVIIPLWWRGIQTRCAEPGRFWGGDRKHPKAKLGDSFGCWTVVELLRPDYTSNERVVVRCPHGVERTAYVFNLRKSKGCRHNQKALAASC
jgi:hypothetical protein